MAKKLTPTEAKIANDLGDLENMLEMMPDNPIAWGVVLGIVAPVIARLAVRMALKRVARGLAEDKIRSITDVISALIKRGIESKDGSPTRKGQ